MDKILNKLNSGFENKYITFFNLFGLLPAMLHLLWLTLVNTNGFSENNNTFLHTNKLSIKMLKLLLKLKLSNIENLLKLSV